MFLTAEKESFPSRKTSCCVRNEKLLLNTNMASSDCNEWVSIFQRTMIRSLFRLQNTHDGTLVFCPIHTLESSRFVSPGKKSFPSVMVKPVTEKSILVSESIRVIAVQSIWERHTFFVGTVCSICVFGLFNSLDFFRSKKCLLSEKPFENLLSFGTII